MLTSQTCTSPRLLAETDAKYEGTSIIGLSIASAGRHGETDRNGARRRRLRRSASRRRGQAARLRRHRRGRRQQRRVGPEKAEALGARRGYGSYQALIDDPDVQVVHNATPNYLHYAVTSAALAKGKHVVSDKPLAMTAAESKRLVEEARRAGVVTAVTFNYRGNPLVQQARLAIARGDIGAPHFLHGHYLQDWLLKETDYSWRLDPEKGGASSALGDIGSHWCDLAQHVSGLRITHVLGDITTVRPAAEEAARIARGLSGAAATTPSTSWTSPSRISRRCWCGSTTARRAASRSARSAPATRTTWCSRCAGRRRRSAGGRSTRTSCGSAIATARTRCCRRTRRCSTTEARAYAHLPGGHQEAWADAFCNLMRDIYGFIAAGPSRPRRCRRPSRTFEDGYRANCIVEAILDSARRGRRLDRRWIVGLTLMTFLHSSRSS